MWNVFSTREIAIAVWSILLAIWVLSKVGSSSLVHVIRSALRWKIVLSVALMGAYTAAVVLLLRGLGLWIPNLLKDTIYWFVLSGVVATFTTLLAKTNEIPWRRLVFDQLKVIVILEYIVNTYTFSLPVELVLVPVVTLLALLDVVARRDTESPEIRKFIGGLQALVGFAILGLAISQTVVQLDTVQPLDALRSVLLGPILSVFFLPLVYSLLVIISYESLLMRLRLGPPKESGLKWYATRRLIRHLGLRPQRIRGFAAKHAWDLTRIRTKADIDKLLAPE